MSDLLPFLLGSATVLVTYWLTEGLRHRRRRRPLTEFRPGESVWLGDNEMLVRSLEREGSKLTAQLQDRASVEREVGLRRP